MVFILITTNLQRFRVVLGEAFLPGRIIVGRLGGTGNVSPVTSAIFTKGNN